jgi:hypothetical protein
MKNDDLVPYYYGCIVLILALSGCAGLQPVIATDYAIASGEADRTIKSVKLKDSERMIVDHAINQYNVFIERWKTKNLVENREEFLYEFRELKKQYYAVDAIVKKHWQEYTPAQQAQLLEYQEAAISLNATTEKLARLDMWRAVGVNALSFGTVLLGIAKTL